MQSLDDVHEVAQRDVGIAGLFQCLHQQMQLVIVNAVGMQLVKQLTRHVQILQSSPNQIEHPKLMRRTHGSHSSGMFVEGAAATRDAVPEVSSTGSGINR